VEIPSCLCGRVGLFSLSLSFGRGTVLELQYCVVRPPGRGIPIAMIGALENPEEDHFLSTEILQRSSTISRPGFERSPSTWQ
jgi:hypothetical protein